MEKSHSLKSAKHTRQFKIGEYVTRYRTTGSHTKDKLLGIKEGPYKVVGYGNTEVDFLIQQCGTTKQPVHVHLDDIGVFAQCKELAISLRDAIRRELEGLNFVCTVDSPLESGRCTADRGPSVVHVLDVAPPGPVSQVHRHRAKALTHFSGLPKSRHGATPRLQDPWPASCARSFLQRWGHSGGQAVLAQGDLPGSA